MFALKLPLAVAVLLFLTYNGLAYEKTTLQKMDRTSICHNYDYFKYYYKRYYLLSKQR